MFSSRASRTRFTGRRDCGHSVRQIVSVDTLHSPSERVPHIRLRERYPNRVAAQAPSTLGQAFSICIFD